MIQAFFPLRTFYLYKSNNRNNNKDENTASDVDQPRGLEKIWKRGRKKGPYRDPKPLCQSVKSIIDGLRDDRSHVSKVRDADDGKYDAEDTTLVRRWHELSVADCGRDSASKEKRRVESPFLCAWLDQIKVVFCYDSDAPAHQIP